MIWKSGLPIRPILETDEHAMSVEWYGDGPKTRITNCYRPPDLIWDEFEPAITAQVTLGQYGARVIGGDFNLVHPDWCSGVAKARTFKATQLHDWFQSHPDTEERVSNLLLSMSPLSVD